MQLNIYLISHPIIKLLSENINNNELHEIIRINNSKKIGLLLVYETMRKIINIHNMYIKTLSITKNISIIDTTEKFYLITNLSKTYNMITEIQLMLPNLQIINTESKSLDKLYKIVNYSKDIEEKKIKIIIMENILSESWLIKIIEYISKNTAIPMNNVNIACITCHNYILNNIGNQYPKLNIYTTKIIQ
uniref:Uracil phosphoribosyltransferase n=1 Tax=Sphondylothamnion multifidum TaxID=193186 RepID=A0A4D6WZ56_9FLOR|nr:hypothetical protein [Sphondylothamnion multifidum]